MKTYNILKNALTKSQYRWLKRETLKQSDIQHLNFMLNRRVRIKQYGPNAEYFIITSFLTWVKTPSMSKCINMNERVDKYINKLQQNQSWIQE